MTKKDALGIAGLLLQRADEALNGWDDSLSKDTISISGISAWDISQAHDKISAMETLED